MHRDEVRLGIARNEGARIMLWASALLIGLSLVNLVSTPDQLVASHVIDAGIAIVLILTGLAIRREAVTPTAVPWLFAAAVTLAQVGFSVEMYIEGNPVIFAYLAIVMTAFGPTVLAWRPVIVGSTVMLAAVIVVVLTWEAGRAAELIVATVAALSIGAMLLFGRLRSIDALADATELARQLAVTDELTDLLNRHGLQARVGVLTAMAARLDTPIFAVFVDIDGLKVANDRYGHVFGDEVITTAARALQDSVRGGDLVARWGGDELVVVGLGRHPDPEDFILRLDEHVSAGGIDRAKWPGSLSAGFAYGNAEHVSIDELIEQADSDMYRRRGAR